MDDYKSVVDEILSHLETYVSGLDSMGGIDGGIPDGLFGFQDALCLIARVRYFFYFPILNERFRDEAGLAVLTGQLRDILISFVLVTQNVPWSDFIEKLLKVREAEVSAYWVSKSFEESHPSLYGVDYTELSCDSNSIRLLSRQTCSTSKQDETVVHPLCYAYELTVHDLESPIEWECLSYTWTSPINISSALHSSALVSWWDSAYWATFLIPVIVNGRCVLCTPNLGDYLVLHGLNQRRHFWTDFLCIDQTDDADKATQITKMQSIYERAQNVDFWLGLPGAQAIDVLELIESFSEDGSDALSNTAAPSAGPKSPPISEASDESAITVESLYFSEYIEQAKKRLKASEHLWIQFSSVFQLRNAFTRRWILQEIHLNTKVTLVLGEYSINFASFLSLMDIFIEDLRLVFHLYQPRSVYSRTRTFGLPLRKDMPFYAYNQLMISTAVNSSVQEDQSAMTMIVNLMESATTFKNTWASDSLLGIYAFVDKICNSYHCTNPINVSRSQSPEQMFEEFAATCLSSDPTLSMLELCLFLPESFYYEQYENLTLASWVPNFYKMSLFKYEGLGNAFHQWTSRRANLDRYGIHLDSTQSKNSVTRMPFHRWFKQGKMGLFALKYTKVSHCVSLERDSDPYEEKWNTTYDRIFNHYMSVQEGRENNDGYREWVDREIDNYFGFLLLKNAELSRIPGTMERSDWMAHAIGREADPLARFLRWLASAEETVRDTLVSAKNRGEMKVEPAGRAYFVTSKSRYGAGPVMQRKGDEIWLLQGASFLITLRPVLLLTLPSWTAEEPNFIHEKIYRIVGTCLVERFSTRRVVQSGRYAWQPISIV